MAIDKIQLKNLIRRTLKKYNLWSEDAEFLVRCTIAQESHNGTYIRQKVRNFAYKRHALGIAQMERNTFLWLQQTYLDRYGLYGKNFKELEYNLELSILLCRLRYLVVPAPLPSRFLFDHVWKYYKKYYNSMQGSATKDEFENNYRKYVLKGKR